MRPLTGSGDWLERVVWLPADTGREKRKVAKAVQVVQRLFRAEGSDDMEVWSLANGHGDNPKKRLALVEALQAFLRYEDRSVARTGRLPSDTVLAPMLAAEAERLAQRIGLARLRRRVDRAVATLHHPIYPYQREGLDCFMRTGTLLLADDMGLGKTVQAIAAATTLWRLGQVKRGLLLVPAALKTQWLREWEEFSDAPAQVVDGPPEARARLYRGTREGFLIANYELVLRDLAGMRGFAPELMVLDEAQRIKNWATKTAGLVKQLRPPYRLVLTGTPMENRLEELASIMDWVDGRALEPKWRLVPWHTTAADGRKAIIGARNLDTLRERLSPVLLRRVRQEVLSQLPERTDTRVPVTFTEAQFDEHQALAQPILRLMRRAEKRPLTQAEFLRLMSLLTQQRIICNGLAQLQFAEIWPTYSQVRRPTPAQLRRLDSPKLLEFREMMSLIVGEQRRKVVVFSQWRRMLQLAQWAVQDVLADCGVRGAFFSGGESQKRRTQNIVDFHDDPDMGVLFCSDAGGVGLNLQRAASCLINLDLPWNPAVLEQRIGRIHRLGQTQPIQVYHLISEAGIEARMESTIGVKKALFDGLFDGSSDVVEFDHSASFLDQLEQVLDTEEDHAGDGEAAADDDPDLDDFEEALGGGDTDEWETPIGELAQAAPGRAAESSGSDPSSDGLGKADTDLEASADAGTGFRAGVSTDPVTGPQIERLFERLEIQRKPDGGVTIDAPPEAAQTLAALFTGMARLIAEAAPPTTEDN